MNFKGLVIHPADSGQYCFAILSECLFHILSDIELINIMHDYHDKFVFHCGPQILPEVWPLDLENFIIIELLDSFAGNSFSYGIDFCCVRKTV